MPGLDTNALVRWLVADDDLQLGQVERLVEALNLVPAREASA